MPLLHGIQVSEDLPIPLWLVYYGAALVLVVSFVALGVLWRRPLLERRARGKPLPRGLQRILLSPALRVILGALSLGLFVLLVSAGLAGTEAGGANLAPTFVYVVFWVGLVPLVVVLGNLWAVLSPWRAAADGASWLWARTGREWERLDYPERLGRWPAALGLLAFVTLEIAYTDNSNPRKLALAILVYTWVTWLGMAAYGRDVWLERGEAFHVYFGLLARLAPFAVRDDDEGRRRIVARWPATGLAGDLPGTLPVVAVMLGSVAFDGFSGTSLWQQASTEVLGPLLDSSPGAVQLARSAFDFGGLVLACSVVAVAYLACVAAARRLGSSTRSLGDAFLAGLIPIALAYTVAHYFTLLVVGGQLAIPLLGDPYGSGWNVLGLRDFQPNFAPFSRDTVWYVQVTALVVGHVLGLALAHDRAVSMFQSARAALQTQYAMLVLMVAYTVGGLWLLSNG